MSEKKTMIHFIYNLARGGAESMLIAVLKELKEYNNIVVTLSPENHFENELECNELICLHSPSLFSIPLAFLKLRKLIKKINPVLVHSHLPIPNFVARMAVPANIPLVTTIHTSIANAADYKKAHIRMLDKFTYGLRKSKIIAVSNTALEEYFRVLKIKKNNPSVLYTFVDNEKFSYQHKPVAHNAVVKLVSVGSYKNGKNIPYLIEVFKKLTNEDIILEIYGRGYDPIENDIKEAGVKIFLKGQHSKLQEILPTYDAYIMPSKFEGFSLSVLEAMAMKLPLILSDIPSFREQAKEYAVYFNLNSVEDGYNSIMKFKIDQQKAIARAEGAYRLMEESYTFKQHMVGLRKIYQNVLPY